MLQQYICYVNKINAMFKAFRCTTYKKFPERRGIWNDIWLLVVIVLNIFSQRMFTNWEKRRVKS